MKTTCTVQGKKYLAENLKNCLCGFERSHIFENFDIGVYIAYEQLLYVQ